jgi:hypothetical protein
VLARDQHEEDTRAVLAAHTKLALTARKLASPPQSPPQTFPPRLSYLF